MSSITRDLSIFSKVARVLFTSLQAASILGWMPLRRLPKVRIFSGVVVVSERIFWAASNFWLSSVYFILHIVIKMRGVNKYCNILQLLAISCKVE